MGLLLILDDINHVLLNYYDKLYCKSIHTKIKDPGFELYSYTQFLRVFWEEKN